MYDPERGWSLSFAGCGFLGFYYVGVTSCLSERAPHLLRQARKFFGASAGALHCAFYLAGIPLEQRLRILMDLVRTARSRNLGILHPAFSLSKYIRDGLHRHLPDNVHQLLSGKMVMSLTRVSDGENVLVSDFHSKAEVVDALYCSCYIPVVFGLIPPSFRGVVLGEMCLQGYLDALRFLEKNGIRDGPHLCLSVSPAESEPEAEPESLEPFLGVATREAWPEREELLEQVRLGVLSWDESVLETLSPKLTMALRNAMRSRDGCINKIFSFFPVKIMSYVMLPCTLPVESAIAVVQRLVTWLPDMPSDIQWLWWATSHLCSQAMVHLLPASRSQIPASGQRPSSTNRSTVGAARLPAPPWTHRGQS
ncbi:1-acylglycerol-3-phosphate O-acyltransferase PNPLA3 isoform X2 [Cervus elaphus]|uniref:1-acylglycerol-3-phosphate O-acyltransferase PNPLA3 isoform X2 n=1 Tax=Cervus elaphus TaxID=9860 RepID=UPI001CC2E2D3|nr:1-acylglycerol-3-phosphate O-acyltransferase PNPLA3 isoform X2 [Cervus elaphus]